MKTYDVVIKETLQRRVTVEASSAKEAENAARKAWNSGDDGFILDADDFTDVSFEVVSEIEFRELLPEERLYVYNQSSQISAQTGLIGYLRADMDTDGNGFFSNWTNWRKDLKTDEFKDEFDELINTLRANGKIFSNRKTLAYYCYSSLKAFDSQMNYGVRVDTKKYAYLFRLNPNKGEYNLYCHCYVKQWLNGHIEAAKAGIRFITPDYKEIFRIADGDSIRIQKKDGSEFERVCRFVDGYHLEVGENLYHICQFGATCSATSL